MTRIDNLIITTDFDTLRNDDSGQTAISIPGSQTIGGYGTLIQTADITLGKAESLLNVRVNSSKEGSHYYPVAISTRFSRTGSRGVYGIFVACSHAGGNTIRATVIIPNPYGLSMVTASGTENFTFLIKTYNQPKFS